MSRFQAARGTQDILPDEQPWWDYVRRTAEETARRFGYAQIETPMFEDASLFTRGVGEVTDIVEKEMYVFEDRGGQQLALRPEGTAPVCRAYLEHGMHNQPQPVRLWYLMPNFRYDRPQAGRYREHHQFGVEAIGDGDAAVDAEVIELLWRFYETLGLEGLTLHLNSIGDQQLPAALPRGAARLLPRQARQSLRRLPARLRAQPAAAARLQERALPADHRRRARVHGLPLRRLRRALLAAAWLSRSRRHPVPARLPAGARPGLLHADGVRGTAARRGRRRAASAAAAATTG